MTNLLTKQQGNKDRSKHCVSEKTIISIIKATPAYERPEDQISLPFMCSGAQFVAQDIKTANFYVSGGYGLSKDKIIL